MIELDAVLVRIGEGMALRASGERAARGGVAGSVAAGQSTRYPSTTTGAR